MSDEVIESHGLRLPVVPALMPPRLMRRLQAGLVQSEEAEALAAVLHPGDRVLVLGAGIGLLPALAARHPGARVSVADPDAARLSAAAAVLALNGLAADLLPWPDGAPPQPALAPQVLIADLTALPPGSLDRIGLGGLRAAVLRLPRRLDRDGRTRLTGLLAAEGLYLAAGTDPAADVQVFRREDSLPHPFPPRSFRPWPIAAPRVFLATCMKNEGPFLLEWVAWHKAVGVTDLVVFTNHCTDGTDLLLDRLAALGHLRHLPNPALATGERAYQPVALNYAHLLPEMRAADFFLSMDADEFINVRVGDGTLQALFDATGPFDVLSMSELNHGANGQQHYRRGWLTDLFPGHQTSTPGRHKARRGVKSITRLSPRALNLRNHRPQMRDDLGPVLWLDGSGRVTHHFLDDRDQNGHDARGTYDLVRMEHFALRSLETFLAKMDRGDAVVEGKKVTQTYWRQRNLSGEATGGYGPQQARARAWYQAHLAPDAALMALHDAACAAHEARIARLLQDPEFRARRDWALAECWRDDPTEEGDTP